MNTSSTQTRAASPTNVDTSLDYITVENYEWPKYTPPKRSRLDDDERKRRHREGQRQFMCRKRSRIAVLRPEVTRLELQLRLVTAMVEQKSLEEEAKELRARLVGPTTSTETPHDDVETIAPLVERQEKAAFIGPAESEVLDSPDLEKVLIDALLSW